MISVVAAAVILLPAAMADTPVRSGIKVIGEYSEAVKTDFGQEIRQFRVEYHWDEGATYTRGFDKHGEQVSLQVVKGSPAPDEQEIEEAFAIVHAHPDTQAIKARQAGIDINGGFPFQAKTGACASPARCVQIFLFDAENVVRHMLVDLRSQRVVNTDYIPPQNRRAQQ